MSKIHSLPTPAQAEQEAGAWIARLMADDATAEDLARFEVWCAQNPRNAQVFEQMSGTIDEVKQAGRLVRAVSFGNAMQAVSRFGDNSRARRWGSLAAAASILGVIAASVWWLQRVDSRTLFQTAVGEHASIELPDGSKLELNSNSAARVEYSGQARTIRLTRGEAYFEVAPDPQRPFAVLAGDSWIQALGTAFNVDLRSSGVRVFVSEGKVRVGAERSVTRVATKISEDETRGPLILTAGQQAELKSGLTQVSTAAPAELKRVQAWRKGRLYFENRTLESVIGELGRYSAAEISIEDEALGELAIGGTFQANPQGVEALLEMLEQGFGLEVHRQRPDRIVIRAR